MSCYRNILVALDGSPDSAAALRHAATLARDQNARLTLLTVVPRGPSPVGAGVPAPPDLTELHQGIVRDALEALPRDISVTTRIERGDVGAAILRVAAEADQDLVVMGSHGHSRVRRALLGSVSERVLRDAAVPVLLTRGERPDGEAPDGDGALATLD
jgi:nucleotide-binding universal stress UspA family protein